jgi:hypothetical protein
MNKSKVINLLLLFTSLIGYLEWGKGNSSFLFQAEWDILKKMFSSPSEYLHPFILIPFFGQLLLIISLFQKQPSRLVTFLGIACIGLLLLFMLLVGVLSKNVWIILSTLPFLTLATFRIIQRKLFVNS